MSETLQALHFPLWGSRLIEASAGTGKTWTIAALYVRLVLGHGEEGAGFQRPLAPDEILVMTFTRAATRELSDRIRDRLVNAVACFRGEQEVPAQDGFLRDLVASYPPGRAREAAAGLLAMAAESMDDAAIFTIDAWCQRALREHAFDSASLFEETLEPDETQRLEEAVQDYWRQQCYPLGATELQTLLQVWPSLDSLAQDMRSLHTVDLPAVDVPGLDLSLDDALGVWLSALVQHRERTVLDLAQDWEQHAQDYESWLEGQNEHHKSEWKWTSLKAPDRSRWFRALRAWAQDPLHTELELTATARHRLTPDGLLEVRKNGDAIDWPPQAHAFAALLQGLDALPELSVLLRTHATHHVQQRLAWLKRQAGTFGFADMQQRLDAALTGDNGAVLRERVLAQYPVALIDEFQDTSPLQYRLFEQVYRTEANDPNSALLLIGDPKQSIYGFRGADIYSYLRARKATQGRHYVLDTNYRSTPELVAAVNQWFAQAEQRPGRGAFDMRHWEGGEVQEVLPFLPVKAQGRKETLQCAGQPVEALEVVWFEGEDGTALSAKQLRRPVARACAQHIVQWLNDEHMGFAQHDKPLQRLRPGDIAVLVRNGKEAAVVRQELQARGVASVYLSDRESVLASAEAADLLLWLQAVSAPLDTRVVRAGLATAMIGKSLQELAQLVADDAAFDAHTEQLRQLQSVWQRQGVLAMLRQTLHVFALPARWLADNAGGERRLTNYLHLAELLQNASAQLEGEQALIRWLSTQVENPGGAADEQIVRLESDADLVKVVTVHKSKGLEYPVVCLPFAYSYYPGPVKAPTYVRVPGEDGLLSAKLDYSSDEKAQADAERLREDLRLFYVALTRPRHLLWMGQAALVSKAGGSSCVNHKAASGYLLGGSDQPTPAQYKQSVQALVEVVPSARLLMAPARDMTRLHARSPDTPLAAPPAYSAEFDRSWSIGSFTALTRAMGASVSAGQAQPLVQARPADDERETLSDTAPVARIAAAPAAHAPVPVWHRFMRGPVVGNLIHDLLEWLAQDDFVLDSEARRAALQRQCERAGYEAQAADAVVWMEAVVQHPLPPLGVPLSRLAHGLTEMEFWLPMEHLSAPAVDALCRHYVLPDMERPQLPQRSLHGMLMGFADLVFVHEGRYWVMDYKTNSLGADGSAYSAAAMAQAMLHHRYDVQAALYMLALHRLLRSRLGDAYDPAQHLGGALYFFVRGLDGEAAGVHVVPPVLELLEGLEAVLAGQTPEMWLTEGV